MKIFTRRDILKSSAGAAAGVVAGPALLQAAQAWAADSPFTPEKDASIRLLRWKHFVKSEDEAFMALVDAFSKATGVAVRIDNEGFEDLRPKAAVAASIGKGPDIIWTIHADPHLYPDSLVEMNDVADHLGGKYGGWYPIAEFYSKRGDSWISIPYFFSGNFPNYRVSSMKAAGFDSFPSDTDGFLKLMAGLKKNDTPGGFALGNASGDGNCWTHWILWSHGGRVVDEDDKVVINSKETIEGLKYVNAMAQHFLPGCASWLDGHNNKAFLQGECHLTNNGISIYAAAQRENMTDISEDMDHAYWPVGPVGKPMEFHVQFPMMVYKHSPNPMAAKAFITWMMEAPQFNQHLQGSVGYLSHPLRAYDDHPVWTEDPKRKAFRDTVDRTVPYSHSGSLGNAASSVFADFVVVNMVAEAALGTKTPEEAAADAQKRAERYYRS